MYILARIIFFICFCLTVAATAAEQKISIQDWNWLAGCWEEKSGQESREEMWSKSAGGTIVGAARLIVDGKTSEYEFMRIHQEADGIYFTAQPFGRPPTSFKAKRFTLNEAIFENLKSDFPQRVIYRRKASGSLEARIEGKIKGKPQGFDFSFHRAACESASVKEVAYVH